MRLIDADALGIGKANRELFEKPEYADGWNAAIEIIEKAKTIDDVPVVHGRWEWFEEWSPSTPEHLRECDDCGWRCGKCKTALEDMVGGYWDDIYEKPKLNYCPNCGAKMDLEADGDG